MTSVIMPSRLSWFLIFTTSFVLCAALAVPPRSVTHRGHLPPLLPRIEVIRVIGAPIHHLVTDYFWIQTIQAVGKASNRHEYRDIYDYADLTTELDPQFRQVYVFAGVTIPYRTRSGKWFNVEESTRLLEKGLKYFPEQVYLRIMLAYNLSAFHHEYERAAVLLEEASRFPDAPEYLSGLATRLHAQAGNFDAAVELARSLAEASPEPETQAVFELRVKELELERELARVDAAAQSYQQREGRLPESIEALVVSGDLSQVPVDPLDGDIRLGAGGRSFSTAQEKRLTDSLLVGPEGEP